MICQNIITTITTATTVIYWHFGDRSLHQCNLNKKEKKRCNLRGYNSKLCYNIYTNIIVLKLQKCSFP